MRVALCVKSIDGKGGIQRNYKLWYELFKKKGDEVYLFVLQKPEYEKMDKNIIVLQGKNVKQKGKNLEEYLKKLGCFDLFLLNAEYLKKYVSQPYYITVHNTWEVKGNLFKRIKRFNMLKKKYKNERLIGISRSVLENITANLKIPVKSKHVVYAPHNIEKVRELAAQKDVKGNYIVAVGSLIKRKNYELLLKSFSLIKKDISLYIIGEGKEEEQLKSLAEKLNIAKRVKFLGFKQNPYPYIKNAKLLVNSSYSEGLPRVVVESLILHTPVVATLSSEGIFEVMQNELEEFIVKKFDEKALASKITTALEKYPRIKDEYYIKFSEEESYKRLKLLSTCCETSNTHPDIS